MSCLGLRGFLECGTFSAKTGKVLGKTLGHPSPHNSDLNHHWLILPGFELHLTESDFMYSFASGFCYVTLYFCVFSPTVIYSSSILFNC